MQEKQRMLLLIYINMIEKMSFQPRCFFKFDRNNLCWQDEKWSVCACCFSEQWNRVADRCVCVCVLWDWLWLFAEQRLDEAQGGRVQLLQLLLAVAHVELGDVEKRLLLVLAQERRDPCQHHVGQDADAPGTHTNAEGHTKVCVITASLSFSNGAAMLVTRLCGWGVHSVGPDLHI